MHTVYAGDGATEATIVARAEPRLGLAVCEALAALRTSRNVAASRRTVA